MGDFIEYRNKRIARIEGIFVHISDDGVRRLFVKITKVDASHTARDPHLHVAIIRLEDTGGEAVTIIGLPAISSRLLYIVAITDQGPARHMQLGGQDLLYLDWTVNFL